ncbi:hypothetical protein PVA44_06650 (plasmid) [Entomospira nematocerorum]|uniref:Uncharacterized protein n=1 Tax=Entomospira nematocerorum TaxID=2719987 RepID=A0A968KUR9_9SPIO|nr:hypothetical protein [Entomospira nematocera]NIZ47584.1 hypothetical protein [Entomospira nematocera]WDI34588.1 hypothetical protein PVA44_06650 [Entomospira nematocera]
MLRYRALWWSVIAGVFVGLYGWILWRYQLFSSWFVLLSVSFVGVVLVYPLVYWMRLRYLQPRYFRLGVKQYRWSMGLGLLYGLIAMELFVRYFLMHLLISQAILIVWVSIFLIYSQRTPRATMRREEKQRYLLKAKAARYLFSLVWVFVVSSYIVIFSWGHYRLHQLMVALMQ